MNIVWFFEESTIIVPQQEPVGLQNPDSQMTQIERSQNAEGRRFSEIDEASSVVLSFVEV